MSIKLFCKILYKSKFLHEIIAVAIKLNLISYRRDSPCGCPTQAPSDEGAVVFSRKMTEGEITKSCGLLLSLPQFRYAQQLLPSCGIPILFMRLGAPHKIDRCANKCSLYPPQAAVAYVARQRDPCFIKTENICNRRGKLKNEKKLVLRTDYNLLHTR